MLFDTHVCNESMFYTDFCVIDTDFCNESIVYTHFCVFNTDFWYDCRFNSVYFYN